MPESQGRPDSPQNQDFSKMLEQVLPGLSKVSLQETARTTESLDTVRFVLNPWTPILNYSLSGFGFGVQIPVLERMDLIPIRTWKTPRIMPRTSPFALGVSPTGGVFPAGSVGSIVDRVLQFPAESVDLLVSNYGPNAPNNIGMVELASLASTEDRDKYEAVLLFKAVMKTPFDEGSLRGVDICLEDMPRFLTHHAPALLKRAVQEGIDGYRLKTWQKRGELMIEHIGRAVAEATRVALDSTTGILPRTKEDLIASSKGMKDRKVLPDRLDEWLLTQFPSYSLDTDVERATRANASVTNAIRATGEAQAVTTQSMIEMMQQTFEQLRVANETNRLLLEKLQQGEKAA